MATSAEELSSQAESLKDAVSYFKTDADFHTSSKHTQKARHNEKKENSSLSDKVKSTLHQGNIISSKKLSDNDFGSF
jgi:hypothetical protein